MRLSRHLAFAGVMLIGAALVAWWCTANRVIRMDSPFSSPTFRDYFIFALAGELIVGLPYGLGIRAALRRFDRWSVLSTVAAALVPGIALTLLEVLVGGERPVFGPCVLIAGAAMAAGWYLLRYDAPAGQAHA